MHLINVAPALGKIESCGSSSPRYERGTGLPSGGFYGFNGNNGISGGPGVTFRSVRKCISKAINQNNVPSTCPVGVTMDIEVWTHVPRQYFTFLLNSTHRTPSVGGYEGWAWWIPSSRPSCC